MKLHTPRPWLTTLVFAIVCALVACDREVKTLPATQIVVAVNSDLQEQLASIELQVFRNDEQSELVERKTLALGAERELPLSFTVVPRSEELAGSFLLVVTGVDDGGDSIVQAKTWASFVPRKTLGMVVWLLAACRDVHCDPGQTCVPSTPTEGECADAPVAITRDVAPGNELQGADVLSAPERDASIATDDGGAPEMDAQSTLGQADSEALGGSDAGVECANESGTCGDGQAGGGECTEGLSRCADASVAQRCSDAGTWEVAESCAQGCSVEQGGCRRCEPGANECHALQPVTCRSDGLEWIDSGPPCTAACTRGACVCAVGEPQRCQGTQVVACNDQGAWVAVKDCKDATPVCVDGTCKICQPGATRCQGAVPQVCDENGAGWRSNPVVTGTCGAECDAGTTNCSGNLYRTCDAQGHWSTGAIVGGKCGADCTPSQSACVGTANATPQTCNSVGKWQTQPVAANVCGAVCTPGQTGCTGTANATPRTCNAVGQWSNGAVLAGSCGAVCTPPSQTSCSDTTPRSCTSVGQWQNGSVSAGTCGAECTPGQTRCTGSCNASFQQCTASGRWQDLGVGAGRCGASCTPGTTTACSSPLNCTQGSRVCNGCGQYGPCGGYTCSEFAATTSESFGCSNLCSGASCNFQVGATCPAGTVRTRCDAVCISGCCVDGNRQGCNWGLDWISGDPSDASCFMHVGTAGCNGTTLQIRPFCIGK